MAVEPVKGNLQLSGYSACGQDGGVQLPREYVEGISLQLIGPILEKFLLLIIWALVALPDIFEFMRVFNFIPVGVADADLVLLVTTRPTTGNTLAWAVACERDQWGRAIAGNSLM